MSSDDAEHESPQTKDITVWRDYTHREIVIKPEKNTAPLRFSPAEAREKADEIEHAFKASGLSDQPEQTVLWEMVRDIRAYADELEDNAN